MRHVVDRPWFWSFACLPDCLENTLILRVTGCRFPNPVIDVYDVISGLRHSLRPSLRLISTTVNLQARGKLTSGSGHGVLVLTVNA